MDRWYQNLYIGAEAEKERQSIIQGIKKHKLMPDIFVVTLPAADGNVLEFYPSVVLNQKHYRHADLFVVGIAKGRSEALDVIQCIIMDCYTKTGNFDVRQFVEM